MNCLIIAFAVILEYAGASPHGWGWQSTAHWKSPAEEAIWHAKAIRAAEELAVFKAKEAADVTRAEAAADEAAFKARNDEALAKAKAAEDEALGRQQRAKYLAKAKAEEEEALGKAKEAAGVVRAEAAADEAAFKARNEATLAKAKAAEDEARWRAGILAARYQQARKAGEAALWNAKNAALQASLWWPVQQTGAFVNPWFGSFDHHSSALATGHHPPHSENVKAATHTQIAHTYKGHF